MTEEEKQLLLKDLCVRLPYRVKVSLNKNNIGDLTAVYPFDGCVIIENLKNKIPFDDFYFSDYGRFTIDEDEVKPYLRPLSSMTEEEKQLVRWFKSDIKTQGAIDLYMNRYIEWLDSRHFDWRTDGNGKTLIEKGLALEAPADMYEVQN